MGIPPERTRSRTRKVNAPVLVLTKFSWTPARTDWRFSKKVVVLRRAERSLRKPRALSRATSSNCGGNCVIVDSCADVIPAAAIANRQVAATLARRMLDFIAGAAAVATRCPARRSSATSSCASIRTSSTPPCSASTPPAATTARTSPSTARRCATPSTGTSPRPTPPSRLAPPNPPPTPTPPSPPSARSARASARCTSWVPSASAAASPTPKRSRPPARRRRRRDQAHADRRRSDRDRHRPPPARGPPPRLRRAHLHRRRPAHPGNYRASWLAAVFRAWAHRDFGAAMTRAAALDGERQAIVARAVLEMDIPEWKREAAAARLGAERLLGAIRVREDLAAADGDFAFAWQRAMSAVNATERHERLRRIAFAWVVQDPQSAAAAGPRFSRTS